LRESVNPYAAPRAPQEGPPSGPSSARAAMACRIAGAFLLAGALAKFLPWVTEIPPRMLGEGRHLTWSTAAVLAFTGALPLLVYAALAVPLLRGSRRYWIATLAVASLSVVSSVIGAVGVMAFARNRAVTVAPWAVVPAIGLALLFLAVLALLIAAPATRGRVAIAVAGIALQLTSWLARLLA
jgi:hypothetical protein